MCRALCFPMHSILINGKTKSYNGSQVPLTLHKWQWREKFSCHLVMINGKLLSSHTSLFVHLISIYIYVQEIRKRKKLVYFKAISSGHICTCACPSTDCVVTLKTTECWQVPTNRHRGKEKKLTGIGIFDQTREWYSCRMCEFDRKKSSIKNRSIRSQ